MLTFNIDPIPKTNRADLIPWPLYASEDEVRARLLSGLKQALHNSGYTIRAEVEADRTPEDVKESRRKTTRHAQLKGRATVQAAGKRRIDLVIFTPGAAAAILIETKRDPSLYSAYHQKEAERLDRQTKRYARYGLPLLVCIGTDDIEPTIEKALEIICSGDFK